MRKIFEKHSSIIKSIIKNLRKNTPLVAYNNQEYYSDAKKALNLPKSFYPVRTN